MDEQRNMTFAEREHALAVLRGQMEAAEDAGLPVPPEVEGELRQMLVGAVEKRDALVWFLRESAAKVDAIKAEEEHLARMRKTMENRIAWVERYIVETMNGLGIKALSGNTRTLRVQQNPASVECEGEPPVEYARVVPEERHWDKRKVKEALERGEQVVNARLKPGAFRLVVK